MPITLAELQQIIADVWLFSLGMQVEPDTSDEPLGTDTLAARVRISGPWEGTLILRCHPASARRWAEAMLELNSGGLSDEAVNDALGELANMVAGNVKGLLAGDSRLSLPIVSVWYLPEAPRTGRVVAAARVKSGDDILHAFLLSSAA